MLALLLPEAAAATTATRIIVQREPGLSAAERADIRADAGVRLVRTLSVPRTEVVAASPGDVGAALARLRHDADVVAAAPDRVVHALSNDTFFHRQWALENTGPSHYYSSGTDNADMEVPAGWDLSPRVGPMVAVVDSGVFGGHLDLAGQVANGYDWVDLDTDASDEHPTGHGTHIGGIIAATKDNNRGIAGVAPKARILPLRVLDEDGEGSTSHIVDAFRFVDQQHIRVVNVSFASTRPNEFEEAAIRDADTTLFVAAAGNGNANNDGPGASFPCSYDLPNVLCVGASDYNDLRASFSNFGANSVDVFAPGYHIWSTVPGGAAATYQEKDGTSLAAPHVAGLASLMLGRDPSLTVAELRSKIISSVDPISAFTSISVSGGRVDAARAVGLVADDHDGDGVELGVDNCPDMPNPDQAPGDTDTPEGAACEFDGPPPDADGDAVVDAQDTCPYERGQVSAGGCPGTMGDADADGQPDMLDRCAEPGALKGCTDSDGDGIADIDDNCDLTASPNQTDDDGDGEGNVCDSTPRGHNDDGDHLWQIDDSCPDVYGTLANGCPAPTPMPAPPPPPNRDGDDRYDASDACPTEYGISKDGCPLPQIASLSGKIRKRGTRRSVTVSVVTTRHATVRVTIERKRGRRWARVKRNRVSTVANRARVVARGVRPGRYRVRVSISNGAGSGTPLSKRFRIR